jgi:hypothetical protein
VQAKVQEEFPGAIVAMVETSGDGAVNFYSRVQLYLFKAREQAEAEVAKALEETGLTMDQVRAYLKAHPGLDSPIRLPPHRAACTAADVVYMVHDHMHTTRLQRASKAFTAFTKAARHRAEQVRAMGPDLAKTARTVAYELSTELADQARTRLLGAPSAAPQ